ncbi:hypothetical protein HY256_00260 [Candidatus Sumerlaeota bacterium]|nr:hypothetical protein [Candidatus Sumerlaeota bacterium]
MRKTAIYLMMGLVWIAGNLSPLALIWLLWPRLSPVKSIADSAANPLLIDFFAALIFPLQHSIWTQTPVKRALKNLFGELLERPFYVLTSGIALIAGVWLWRCSDMVVWAMPEWAIWPMRGIFVGMLGAQLYCTNVVGAKFLIGLAHLKSLAVNRPLRAPEFKEAGLYRLIRHPIAASQIIMVWAAGTMFADRLLLAVMWTVWIVTATALEDRRLAREFGDSYAAYRRRAGFLWPRLVPGSSRD